MSATFKGTAAVVLVADEPFFDPENGTRGKEQTFQGSKLAIYGLANGLELTNTPYRVSHVGGALYSLTCRLNFNDPETEDLDRYEIATESIEKSIFEFPTVISEAQTYDSSIAVSAETWRKKAENAVESKQSASLSTNFDTVVNHLKNGVTGFSEDFITLRRFRKIDLTYSYAAGKFNLADGNIIYSTAQLNLPSNVAFQVPVTPANPSSIYRWGWKRRGQRVEIVGQYVEQTVELLFAPWSTLLYTTASGNLDW